MRIHRQTAGALVVAASMGLLAACGGGGSTAATTSPATPAKGSSTPPASPTEPLAGKTIVLDPGHNGKNAEHPEIIHKQVDVLTKHKDCNTTGTSTNDGYPEHAFTWSVASKLAKVLRADGAKVVLTRKNDKGVGPCVTERAATGNRAHADAVLSIHADGAPEDAHGFHIIEPAPIKQHTAHMVKASAALGKAMRDAYHKGTGIPYSTYLGKKGIDVRDDLGGLNLSKVPAVFIECGNMRNPDDAAKMKSSDFRERMAEALAQGFVHYLS